MVSQCSPNVKRFSALAPFVCLVQPNHVVQQSNAYAHAHLGLDKQLAINTSSQGRANHLHHLTDSRPLAAPVYAVEDEDQRRQQGAGIRRSQQSTGLGASAGAGAAVGRGHAHEHDLVLRQVHVRLPEARDERLVRGDGVRERLCQHTRRRDGCDMTRE